MARIKMHAILTALLVLSGHMGCSALPSTGTPSNGLSRLDSNTATGVSRVGKRIQSSDYRAEDHNRALHPDDAMDKAKDTGLHNTILVYANQNSVVRLAEHFGIERSDPKTLTEFTQEYVVTERLSNTASSLNARLLSVLDATIKPLVAADRRVASLPDGPFKIVECRGNTPETTGTFYKYAFNPIDGIIIRLAHAPLAGQVPLAGIPRPPPQTRFDPKESGVVSSLWNFITADRGEDGRMPNLPKGWARHFETTVYNIHEKRDKLEGFVDALVTNQHDLAFIATVKARSKPPGRPAEEEIRLQAGSPNFMALVATSSGQLVSKILSEQNEGPDRRTWGRKVISAAIIVETTNENPSLLWEIKDWSREAEKSLKKVIGQRMPWNRDRPDWDVGDTIGTIDAWLQDAKSPSPQQTSQRMQKSANANSSGISRPPQPQPPSPGPSQRPPPSGGQQMDWTVDPQSSQPPPPTSGGQQMDWTVGPQSAHRPGKGMRR